MAPLTRLIPLLLASLYACTPPTLASEGNAAPKPAASYPAISDDNGQSVVVGENQRHALRTTSFHEIPQSETYRWPATVEIQRERIAAVAAPLDAFVEQLHTHEGQAVRAGDTLITLRSPALAEKKAELRTAREILRRAKEVEDLQASLMESGSGLRNAWQQAISDRAQAQNHVRALEVLIRSLESNGETSITLRAPIDGFVTGLRTGVGERVSADTETLLHIAPRSAYLLRADLFERDAHTLHVGDEAQILPGEGAAPLPAHVVRIAPSVSTDNDRVAVWFKPDGELALAAGRRASVQLDRPAENLRVPTPAIVMTAQGEYRVWVETAPRTFIAKPVVLGTSRQGFTQIVSGLRGDESIVVRGALLLDTHASQRL